MSEDGFSSLADKRMAVIGLGLMGGSLALALHGKVAALSGYDPDPQVVSLAKQRKVVEHASSDLSEILAGTDLIVLAAPVLAILEILNNLDHLHPDPPVGGHPMCGKEKASLINADPLIYRGATFALTLLSRTSQQAKQLVQELVSQVGSQVFWLDAEVHDRWAAATSHLPYLLANALTLATPLEAAPLIGPGFLSTSRLAGGYAPMMLDVVRTNRQNILQALRNFRDQLDEIELCLDREDFKALEDILHRSTHQHEVLTSGGGR
jgi:prephenate dehydrogenase